MDANWFITRFLLNCLNSLQSVKLWNNWCDSMYRTSTGMEQRTPCWPWSYSNLRFLCLAWMAYRDMTRDTSLAITTAMPGYLKFSVHYILFLPLWYMLIPCLEWLIHPTIAQDKCNSKLKSKTKTVINIDIIRRNLLS